MNAADNVKQIQSVLSNKRSPRTISMLQLSTALALVALPATVLFPVIATSPPTADDTAFLNSPYCPQPTPHHELSKLRHRQMATKYRVRAIEQTIWKKLQKISDLNN